MNPAGQIARRTALPGRAAALALVALVAGCLCPGVAVGATPVLPDLVADSPENGHLEMSTTEGNLKPPGEAKLLLRFDGYIHNVGKGALEIEGSRGSSAEAMKVFQRVFNSDGSSAKEPSTAELKYVTADGHEHWHLERAAKYSLWNSARSAEMAPAQKVGFCLGDSEHVDPFGPAGAVYTGGERNSCSKLQPGALRVWEGISSGWRDRYESTLAFQWVDASNVLPGEYWLREDVNTTGVIKETGGANAPGYAKKPTFIPGFNALPQSDSTEINEPAIVTLTSNKWGEIPPTPKYEVIAGPLHGTVNPGSKGSQEIYTPTPGYRGSDSFSFVAKDPNSPFPRSPAQATVSIQVGPPLNPSLSLNGAPSSMIAGTAVQLTANVVDDGGGVQWEASGGSVSPEGSGLTSSYTAPSQPPPGATVTVTARLHDNPSISDQRTVTILPVPVAQAAVSIPSEQGAGGILGFIKAHGPPRLLRPQAVLLGRKLILKTLSTAPGRIRLSAYLGRRRLGTCATQTPAEISFTCRLTLDSNVSLRAKISVVASLRAGPSIVQSYRPPWPVPQLKRHIQNGPVAIAARNSGSWQFFCGSALAE